MAVRSKTQVLMIIEHAFALSTSQHMFLYAAIPQTENFLNNKYCLPPLCQEVSPGPHGCQVNVLELHNIYFFTYCKS